MTLNGLERSQVWFYLTAIADGLGLGVALIGQSNGRQSLQAGVVDDRLIHLVPVIFGDGIGLFDQLGREIELTWEEVDITAQSTSLRFRVNTVPGSTSLLKHVINAKELHGAPL